MTQTEANKPGTKIFIISGEPVLAYWSATLRRYVTIPAD
jgi:hypothetical protein